MNFQQLQEFITAAHTGSFHTAAQLLFTNVSSISRHIRELENELGTQLFCKGNRGVSLTADGVFLLEKTMQLLKVRDDIYRQMGSTRNSQTNELIIGVHRADVYLQTAEYITAFNEIFPEVHVDVQIFPDHLFSGSILSHKIDVAIELYNPYNLRNEIGRLVIDNIDVFVGVSNTESFEKEKLDIKLLERMTLIIPRRDLHPGITYYIETAQKALNAHFRNVKEVEDILETMATVANPGNWTPIPSHYLQIKPDNIKAVKLPGFPTANLVAMWANDSCNPHIANFLLQSKKSIST